MSASVGTEKVDPNLTPLLDVVLQLIMFFMITVNFVSEQINQNVILPTSESTQEIQAKGDSDVLVLNVEVLRVDKVDPATKQALRDNYGKPIREIVREEGTGKRTLKIIFSGTEAIVFKDGEEMTGIGRAISKLKDQAQIIRRNEGLRLNKAASDIKELKVPVVIRADVEAQFGLIHHLITQCNAEGFTKVELRVMSKTKKT